MNKTNRFKLIAGIAIQAGVLFACLNIARADNSQLNNFYNDFKSPSKPADNSGSQQPAQPAQGGNTYNYYTTPSMDYYQSMYPYNYPYSRFYSDEPVIIQPGQYYTQAQIQQNTQQYPPPSPRHTWYNTALDYQSVSNNLSSVGMMFSIVSAGKATEISYGVKFDYNLYTERNPAGHTSLPISNIGMVFGKQMGAGLVESFVSYCSMQDFSGLSLKLSTDQWIHKYAFITGGFGVSIINNSPLTDAQIGIGLGNTMAQLILGYKSVNSVTTQLNGPELSIKLIM